MGDGRVLFLQVTVPADDAAAVSHDADDTAVLPVADLLMVGPLQEPEELVALLLALVGHLLDLCDEAGPGSLFQLVQHRSTSFGICHRRLPFRLGLMAKQRIEVDQSFC